MPEKKDKAPSPPNSRPVARVDAWGDDHKHAVRLFRAVQLTFGTVARALFMTDGSELRRIPKKGPVILVSNHVSNIDPVLVVASLHRPLYHVGKHTLFTSGGSRWFFQTLGGQIPVNREQRGSNDAAISAAIRVLQRGHAFGIYPEGHRSRDGVPKRGRPGVGRIAYRTGAPCYPVAIEGSMQVWPKGRSLPNFFRPTKLRVGQPRTYPLDEAKARDTTACQQVADELMTDLAQLLGFDDYDAAAAPPAGA